MMVRIKATGEIIQVQASLGLCYYTYGIDGKQYVSSDLEFLKDDSEIDWEAREWNAVVAAIRGVALSADEFTDKEIETISYNAVTLAKALIAKYKKGE